jgi:menaquinone-dependent protoporphyrinogen oxidase
MAAILIVYSTTDGHTRRICERLRTVIEERGHRVTLTPIGAVTSGELPSFDKIVVGASIRYGKHSPSVYEFVAAHQDVLDSKPNAFFSVNIVARKAQKNTPQTNPYVLKFLRQIAWKPRRVAVFAGKLDYPRYGFVDRMMIRFIMFLTKGPTDPKTVVEFTDWQQVEAFGREVAGM